MRTEVEIKDKRAELDKVIFLLNDKRDKLAAIHALDRQHSLYFAQECGELRAKIIMLNWVLREPLMESAI